MYNGGPATLNKAKKAIIVYTLLLGAIWGPLECIKTYWALLGWRGLLSIRGGCYQPYDHERGMQGTDRALVNGY